MRKKQFVKNHQKRQRRSSHNKKSQFNKKIQQLHPIYAPNIRAPKYIKQIIDRSEGRNRQQYNTNRRLQQPTFNNV